MKKCQVCSEKATVFYTQVADGEVKKFLLCEDCAKKQGVLQPGGLINPAEILNFASNLVSAAEQNAIGGKDHCDSCGMTFLDFQRVGRLGCPDCYRAFGAQISPRLSTMHRGVVHRGYLPPNLIKRQAAISKLDDLQGRLEGAIEEEDYEMAASLRDEISRLKSETEGAVL